MSSRRQIIQTTSTTEPVGAALGDEWFEPTSGRLYKRMLSGGVVGWTELQLANNSVRTSNVTFISANSAFANSIVVAYRDTSSTLSINGGSGQIARITDTATGSVFAINSIPGTPAVEVFANGQINLAATGGNINVNNPLFRSYKESVVAATVTTNAQTIDLSLTNIYNLTLANSSIAITFTNPPASGTAFTLTLYCQQDGVGTRALTWPASVRWPNSSPPTMSTGANKIDIFSFFTLDGGTTYLGALSLANTG
jgi:hypothetical protein